MSLASARGISACMAARFGVGVSVGDSGVSEAQLSERAICLLHRYQVVSEAWVRKGGTVGLFKGDAVRDAEM